jgi:hypothetical protein
VRGELRELKLRLAKLEVKRAPPDGKPAVKASPARQARAGRRRRGRRA